MKTFIQSLADLRYLIYVLIRSCICMCNCLCTTCDLAHLYLSCRCCSYVGRIEGYVQPVSIAPWCSYSTTVHEIGHLLGFWHEQSRPDRDQYVTIHTKNIVAGQEFNFVKKNSSDINSLGTPYDFSSIMHYFSGAFAKNNTITISSKIANMPFGRAPELSPLDIKQTNLLYKTQCG